MIDLKDIKPKVIIFIKNYNFNNITPNQVNKKTIMLDLGWVNINNINIHLNKSSKIWIQIHATYEYMPYFKQYMFKLPEELDQFLKLKFL